VVNVTPEVEVNHALTPPTVAMVNGQSGLQISKALIAYPVAVDALSGVEYLSALATVPTLSNHQERSSSPGEVLSLAHCVSRAT